MTMLLTNISKFSGYSTISPSSSSSCLSCLHLIFAISTLLFSATYEQVFEHGCKKNILKAENIDKTNQKLKQHNTSSCCFGRINFIFKSMKAFYCGAPASPVSGSTTLPEPKNLALRRLTASQRKD